MHRKKTDLQCVSLTAEPDVELFHVGPSLDLGPLPCLFYFSLSGRDSLCQDPFNQPVQFLQGKALRIFSMTLPAHENGLSPEEALKVWAEDYEKGQDPLGDFLDKTQVAFRFCMEQKFVDPQKLAVSGLSRGGFLAFHLAAVEPLFKTVVAFAPVIELQQAQEFSHLQEHPRIASLSLFKRTPSLCDRRIRIYIGNNDSRVNTRSSFEFAVALVQEGLHQKIRSPQIEFFMRPSIGAMGHGTPPEVFQEGALWVAECLQIQ